VPDDVASAAPASPASAAPADDRTADRLPRGRHRLSREEVVRSQRERILHGMAAAMAEDGYVGTSVTAILKRAGVSRQTFYEQFASKEECFTATYAWAAETVLEHTVEAAGDASGDGHDPRDPIERMLASYLHGLAAAPELARVLLIETYAAGPAALEGRIALQHRFATQIGAVLGARTDEDRFACEALVGAVSSLVTARLALGDTAGLLALQQPLAALARREAASFGGGA
jgi:AcrR family transcriptional regulator